VSVNERKTWLVAYDIRCPRRLRRVHQRLKREGSSVQYSAYAVVANDREISSLLQQIESLIDARADDVRAYHVPERCPVWALGTQHLPDGITVDAATASGWLLQRSESLAETSAVEAGG
jgi:CRISPR-associated protein Cas2